MENPTISGGVIINPHNIGFQAVFGVPQLASQHKLSHTVDDVRQYYLSLFNQSSLTSNGTMLGLNSTSAPLSTMANVNYIALPTVGKTQGIDAETSIFGNCIDSLRQQLNLTVLPVEADDAVPMCSMLGIGGLVTLNATVFETLGRMVCASSHHSLGHYCI